MRRLRRDAPLLVVDTAVVVASYLIALVVRFEGRVPPAFWQNFWWFLPIILYCHLSCNYYFGLYGRMWRHASVHEVRALAGAGLVAAGLVLGGVVLGTAVADRVTERGLRPVPLSVAALGIMLSLAGFAFIRFYSRVFAARGARESSRRTNVLVVGAGDAGAMILRDLQRNPELGLNPLAVVDDDERKVGRSIHGVVVKGDCDAIPELVEKLQVAQVLLAIPSATSELVRDLASVCQSAGVAFRVLPSVREIVGSRVTVRDIRDLKIEDLLGRLQTEIDSQAVSDLVGGRRVLVTGAGGSIGSEIARQVSDFNPEALALLDRDESLLHEIGLDLPSARLMLADLREAETITTLVKSFRPELVFHAAAHKHVPLLEEHPEEAFRINVLGTRNLARAAVEAEAQSFVFISTDKAVMPESVMGASKRLAEAVLWRHSNSCRFSAVRFGNVLGSRGSVVPTFLRQIQRGGPLTVTDPKMTRYFMSVEEAVSLVLQASAIAGSREIFTLDMGEPVNILELARKLIELSGRIPDDDVKIAFVGPRPGEKYEELVSDPAEELLPSRYGGIVVSKPNPVDPPEFDRVLKELEALCERRESAELARQMKLATRNDMRAEVPESFLGIESG